MHHFAMASAELAYDFALLEALLFREGHTVSLLVCGPDVGAPARYRFN
jgi:hypothetical protein